MVASDLHLQRKFLKPTSCESPIKPTCESQVFDKTHLVSSPSQCFKHYSLLCLRHLFDPKWFYWKYRNSFELICHTCSALPPLGENVYLYLCICVLICCICVSVFVVFVVVYVFAFGHLSHMFRTASTQYIHLCNCFV